MNPVNSESISTASGQGPGAQLAQARADLRLTHAEVAAKLHLASRQIQALEEDDYRDLPGATYVRGYLKSYALLLGLTPGPILDAYARLTAAPVAADFRTIAPHKEITSRHHQVRLVTYIVALLVIGLAAAWWQGRDTRPPNPLLVAPEEQPPVSASDASPATDRPFETGKPAEGAPLIAEPVPAPATGKPEPLPPTVQTPTPVLTPAPAAIPPPIITGPRAKLVLQTEEDSWADIRDARQVKLLYETVTAGRTVTLEGVAPVKIFLGNAAGVRLNYNGQAVDVARHKRGMMARFTLGENDGAAEPVR